MKAPKDLNDYLRHLHCDGKHDVVNTPTTLGPEDQAYLEKMVAAVQSGRSAVIIIEDADDKLKYMFSNASRPEAVSMLGKVIEATGKRLASEE